MPAATNNRIIIQMQRKDVVFSSCILHIFCICIQPRNFPRATPLPMCPSHPPRPTIRGEAMSVSESTHPTPAQQATNHLRLRRMPCFRIHNHVACRQTVRMQHVDPHTTRPVRWQNMLGSWQSAALVSKCQSGTVCPSTCAKPHRSLRVTAYIQSASFTATMLMSSCLTLSGAVSAPAAPHLSRLCWLQLTATRQH